MVAMGPPTAGAASIEEGEQEGWEQEMGITSDVDTYP
jgi:hypothetical protein